MAVEVQFETTFLKTASELNFPFMRSTLSQTNDQQRILSSKGHLERKASMSRIQMNDTKDKRPVNQIARRIIRLSHTQPLVVEVIRICSLLTNEKREYHRRSNSLLPFVKQTTFDRITQFWNIPPSFRRNHSFPKACINCWGNQATKKAVFILLPITLPTRARQKGETDETEAGISKFMTNYDRKEKRKTTLTALGHSKATTWTENAAIGKSIFHSDIS